MSDPYRQSALPAFEHPAMQFRPTDEQKIEMARQAMNAALGNPYREHAPMTISEMRREGLTLGQLLGLWR